MNTPHEPSDELRELCEAAVEGRLTPEQALRLEQRALESAEARRFYTEYLHQHACLQWSAAEPKFLHQPVAPARGGPKPSLAHRAGKRRWLAFAATGLAAALVVFAVWAGFRRPDAASTFATLTAAKACKWDSGSLPTEAGARLAPGRLRLAEGLARIVFDTGAEVTLEGPADLEIVSARRCVLHGGRLVGKVPPGAVGFTVDTPTAVLKDLGTEFGVHVKDERTADVQVFNGLVDVEHRASGRTERMPTGRNLRFGPDAVSEFDPQMEKPPASPPTPEAARVVQISTAAGRGKDTYVQPLFPSKNMSDILLLVKNTVPKHTDWDRKAYVGLDLAPVAGMKVVEAHLTFTFAPTGMGFAAEVPDATFAVYGLTDESLDGWDQRTLRWADAPANRPGGDALDPDKVVRLGTFEIVQGALSGTRGVSGDALADFLNRDTNQTATFILVRETMGSGRSDLVHGFANKRHPSLPPPTLKLTVRR